jgi:phosphate:Na+ symporter
MIGGSLAVRRSSMAHIIFSVVVGILGILFLGPLTAAADWVGARLYDPDGVLAMATFSSLFKLAGIVVFYPWLDGFARFIVRISGKGSDSAVSRLESMQSAAGSPANRSSTSRRSKRSSRRSTSSNRYRSKPLIWAR